MLSESASGVRRKIVEINLLHLVVLILVSQCSSAFFFNLFQSRRQAAVGPIREECIGKARNGDCQFYSCFDERHPCETNNYAMKYGWRFCSRFDLYTDRLTTEGKRWLNGTRLCAMEKLIEFYRGSHVNCGDVMEEMKEGHAACEVENGLCSGRMLSENRQVFSDVYAFNHRSVVSFLHSVKHCTMEKFREATSWFSGHLHTAGELGQSIAPLIQEVEEQMAELRNNFRQEFDQLRETINHFGRNVIRRNSADAAEVELEDEPDIE